MAESAARTALALPAETLRWTCDASSLGFATTADLPLEEHITGQARAIQALTFGLSVNQPGYNIFVSGYPGTGRNTYTRTEVQEAARKRLVPPDWCYVRDFGAADRPIAISLPVGRGRVFRDGVAEFLKEISEGLRRVFTSEAYERQRAELIKTYAQKVEGVWETLEGQARLRGLSLQRTPTGVLTVPVDLRGQPIPAEIFAALPKAEQVRLVERMKELEELVGESGRKIRALEREGRDAIRRLEIETAGAVIDAPLERLRQEYADHPKVIAFLEASKQDMLTRVGDLRAAGADEAGGRASLLPLPRPEPFGRYQVTLLVDNSATRGAPVVVEPNPTYYNLVGKAEYRAEFGTLVTDPSMIRAGALHRANGGYLILQIRDALTSPFAYEGLKRALRSREITIEPLGESLGMIAVSTLRPEPIPLDVKVVLVGTPDLYYLLYALDEEFEKLFKIRSDFDVVTDRTPASEREYARAIASACRNSHPRHFDAGAIAAMLEHSARIAGSQDKLSTRFGAVTEIAFEASAWAGREGRELVTRDDVRRAIQEKVYRSNLIEEKIRELVARGQLLVDTDGAVVGQVNGLSVLQLGDYTFGHPSRITARASLGSRGVVHVEREARMSGRIHTKGVFVLAAFLAARFAQQHPLSISASLTFEQLYSDVDGDSASSTELSALLSELSGLPIDQGIAVTGSVNQMGAIQPIGDVNEKIEGFYAVCRIKGLTGRQGVVIPHQNVRDLMLRDEVADAVREGRFHVWAVRTVDEEIELLTGVAAGTPDAAGMYPADSVNGRVAARLAEFARRYHKFGMTDGQRAHERQGDEVGASHAASYGPNATAGGAPSNTTRSHRSAGPFPE
jgi:predicted ATP-dependent protease